jgi:putative FmdB family regulatory protein
MPTYRFQCDFCGLSFTAHGKRDMSETKCECGAVAKRTLPQGVNVAVSGGNVDLSKDSTGLSGVDYNFDRAVGESSRKNWRGIAQRQRDKIEVVQANRATGFDLSRNPDGTYRVMTPEERAVSERSREFHFKMVNHARKMGMKP